MYDRANTSANLPPARVLVVDDEESLVDLLTTALRFTGYDVTSESSRDSMRLRAVERVAAGHDRARCEHAGPRRF